MRSPLPSKLPRFLILGAVFTAALACGGSHGNLSDGQIFGILETANNGEIKAGQYAQAHAQGASVKSYADMMVSDHTAANSRQMQLRTDQGITEATSTDNTSLQSANDAVYAKLVATPDSAFDSEYVSQMIESHQHVLDILNNDLIPDANNAALKTELQTTKSTVTDHLNQAHALQSQ